MQHHDITHLVEFYDNDGESLPLTKCACGLRFDPWDFILNPDPDHPKKCFGCGRSLYFSLNIRVFEVTE